MNLFNILMFVEIVSILIIGLFTYFRGSKNRSVKYFLFFILFAEIWLLANYFLSFLHDEIYTLWIFRATFATAVLMSFSLLKFVENFPLQKTQGLFIKVVNVLLLVFVSVLCLTDSIIENVFITGFQVDIIYGELFLGFVFAIAFFVIQIIIDVWLQYKTAKGISKQQSKYVSWGIVLFAVFACTTDMFIPVLTGNNVTGNFGQFGLIFIVVSFSYSILAHHLFDIRVIIKKSIVYSALLIFVLATYAAVIFIFTAFFNGDGQSLTVKAMIPNLLAAVFIAAGFEPLRRWLTRLTDKILFKGEYEPQQVLNKLSGVLSSVLDLDEALSSIINVLVSEMRLERAAAFVLTNDPEKNEIVVKRAKSIGYPDVHLTLEPKNHLISYFEKYVKQISKIKSQKSNTGSQNVKEKQNAAVNYKVEALPIITEELERIIELSTEAESAITNTAKELKKLQAAIAIPIIVKGNLIGIFVLGGKKSGDIFTDSDLNLLTVVANQTAAAIEKARFYEEDQLKSEFVSIASHELLTPTSAIEGYLSMILDEGMGKVDAQAKGYLEKVYGSSKRLAHLVKDLLNVSRIEGGRIVVQSQNFDIAAMINDVITETMPKAKQKNLILKADGLDRELPQVWADPDRVHQVLVNLIGNSIKYTEKGSITVRADFSLSVVRVSIIDTGVGIPKDEIPHLFEKFYRASNADNAGAQGTGLGLYITKNIVELMGGMIQVDSELGKGSVFSFSLPRAKDEKKQK